MDPQPPAEADERLDALRRRLYRPDATAEDHRRYAAERQALAASDPPSEADAEVAAEGAPPRRRRRPVALLVVGAVLVAAVGVAETATALHPARVVATPVGRLSADPSHGIRVPVGDVTGPTPFPVSVEGAASVGQRFRGTGSATARLDLETVSFNGGRVVVGLSSPDGQRIGWRAVRVASAADGALHQVVLSRQPAALRPEPTAVDAFTYRTVPPISILVDAPAGAHWTLVVAFPIADDSGLH